MTQFTPEQRKRLTVWAQHPTTTASESIENVVLTLLAAHDALEAREDAQCDTLQAALRNNREQFDRIGELETELARLRSVPVSEEGQFATDWLMAIDWDTVQLKYAKQICDLIERLWLALAEAKRSAPYLSFDVQAKQLAAAIARADALEKALREAWCPRPAKGRPEGDTVGGCVDSDNCGCIIGAPLVNRAAHQEQSK